MMTMIQTSNTVEINYDIECSISFDIKTFISQILLLKDISNAYFEFTFVNSSKMVEINRTHLNRDYVTDIISFNLGTSQAIHADIYICPDKAKENAQAYQQSFDQEVKLLLVHGILHALDYKDYTKEEKAIMEAEQDRLLKEVDHA